MRLEMRAPPHIRHQLLSMKGCQVEFHASPELNGTYACDKIALAALRVIVIDFSVGLGLPGSAERYEHTTVDERTIAFTGEQLQALYRALRDYATLLGYYASGTATSPPPQPVLITP